VKRESSLMAFLKCGHFGVLFYVEFLIMIFKVLMYVDCSRLICTDK